MYKAKTIFWKLLLNQRFYFKQLFLLLLICSSVAAFAGLFEKQGDNPFQFAVKKNFFDKKTEKFTTISAYADSIMQLKAENITASQATLSWAKSVSAKKYTVTIYSEGLKIKSINTSSNRTIVADLKAGTTYEWNVTEAINNNSSATVSFTTMSGIQTIEGVELNGYAAIIITPEPEGPGGSGCTMKDWVLNKDGDGYFTGDIYRQCNAPSNDYVEIGNKQEGDCDDSKSNVYPGAPEICDGLDNDCDGQTDEGFDTDANGVADCFDINDDNDNDGISNELDCAPQDITIWRTGTFYLDGDGDGFGSGEAVSVCYGEETPDGYATHAGDCDDNTSLINPGMPEIDCDGIDNNCDGDEGGPCVECTSETAYRDEDGDGFGNPQIFIENYWCGPDFGGYVANNLDCNDNNRDITLSQIWVLDFDEDGYYVGDPVSACSSPGDGYKVKVNQQPGDCNDYDRLINPGVPEIDCDGMDNNCDYDEGGPCVECTSETGYRDEDGDGFGNPNIFIENYWCGPDFGGYVSNNLDCNDDVDAINPATIWYKDADNDGYSDGTTIIQCEQPADYKLADALTAISGDCDDSKAEIKNGNTWYLDFDGDGYASSTTISCTSPGENYTTDVLPLGDCNDSNEEINPATRWYIDVDNDGYPGFQTVVSCYRPQIAYLFFLTSTGKLPSELISLTPDCDDFNAGSKPQTWYKDFDNDGFTDGNIIESCFGRPSPSYKSQIELRSNSLDCNDNNAQINPLTVWLKDEDNDGYTSGETLQQCTQPANYKLATTFTGKPLDCAPLDPAKWRTGTFYIDGDNDGLGFGELEMLCYGSQIPLGYATNANDCNDDDRFNKPLQLNCPPAIEINNCNTTAIATVTGLAYNTSGLQITEQQLIDANGSIIQGACVVAAITYQDSEDPTSTSLKKIIKRTFTVTDIRGSIFDCIQTITLEDKTAPTVLTKNITVQLNSSGIASISDNAVNNGSTDNCTLAGDLQFSTNIKSFSCSDAGKDVEVEMTVTDANGNKNKKTALVTVEDNVPPVALCKNIEVNLNLDGTVDISPVDIDNGSSDACGIELSIDRSSFGTSNLGANTVILNVKDPGNNSSTCSATVTVKKRPTIIEYTGDVSEQYSDKQVLTAVLKDQLTNTVISNKTIQFTIGTQSASGNTNASGLASAELIITQDPATLYKVKSFFAGDAIYMPSEDEDVFDITQEDARAFYTGALFASTAGTSTGKATVTLSATIKDITSEKPLIDGYGGDIRNATVTFVKRNADGTSTPINNTPLNVGLVNTADIKVGAVTFNWSTDIGSKDAEQFTIGIIVSNYYSRNKSYDNVVVNVAKPLNDFITGGVKLILQNSAGIKAGDIGSENNTGFNVKFNKKGTSLQGNINTIIRRTETDPITGLEELRVYQIKGNVMSSLSVNAIKTTSHPYPTAIFNGKASIQDVTNALSPISLDGNATLQVEITDAGEPGSTDKIAISVWNKDGGLWFSSRWNGTRTEQQLVGGGNLKISGGNFSTGLSATSAVGGIQKDVILEQSVINKLQVRVLPNPSNTYFTIITRSMVNDPISVSVMDLLGRIVDAKQNITANGTLRIGNNYKPGSYIVEIKQGNTRQVIKLIKTPN